MMYIEYLPGQKYGAKNPEMSDDPTAFQDAGLMLAEDEVVIDIDGISIEAIKHLIDTFKIETCTVWTDRGAHFYFKKPEGMKAKEGICLLGFKVEQLTAKNRPNGVTIKRNGIMRDIDNIELRQPLPDIFKVPTGRGKLDALVGMEAGDGRNSALFKHRAKISKYPEFRKICAYINKWVFAEPLEESELESIIRDNVSTKDTDAVEEYEIAGEIMKDHQTVYALGQVWWRDGDGYTHGERDLQRLVFARCPGRRTYFVEEVIRQIEMRSPDENGEKGFPIHFRNGYLMGRSFIPVDHCAAFTPYEVPIEYDENAAPVKIVDDYIDQLTAGDPDYRKLLCEALGYAFVTDPEKIRSLGKFFFLRGDGANGKGTLLQIMQTIYGRQNCSNMSIKQMVEKKYLVSMTGKLANLGDDVEAAAITDSEMKLIKNITTADTMELSHLYKESFSAQITAKLYFTTNNNLKTYEKGYAYERRAKWLPMFIKVEKPDPEFVSKLTTSDCLKYWVKLLVEGYMRLYSSGWTTSELVENFNNEYHKENNPTKEFALSLDPIDILGKTMSEIKAAFYDWAGDDSLKLSSKQFKETVHSKFGFENKPTLVEGATKRVFVEVSHE